MTAHGQMEGGHPLLEHQTEQISGGIKIECRRSLDLYLEISLCSVAGFALILGGIFNLAVSLQATTNRSFSAMLAVLLFLLSVVLIARVFSLLKDGFRKIVFLPDEGRIEFSGFNLFGMLGKPADLRFSDVAGFRLNMFSRQRLPLTRQEPAWEILMILQNSDLITIFPFISSQEKAEEALRLLAKQTGIPAM